MTFPTLRKLHFYLALLLAIPLIVTSLTGALLVYGAELQRLLSPVEQWRVAPQAEPLPLAELVSAVTDQHPDYRVWSISRSLDPSFAYSAWLADGKGAASINQYTGEVLHLYQPNRTYEGWVTALHRRWLSEGKASKWVRHAVSVVALLLVVEVLLGVWIWWKPPKPFQRLWLSKKFSLRYNVLRLHQLTGLVTGLVLIVIAVTGMSFYWDKPIRRLLEIGFQERVIKPSPPAFGELQPLADLGAAIDLAQASVPDGIVQRVQPPDRPGKPAVIALTTEPQTLPTQVWVGDEPQRVLYVFDGRRESTVTWLWQFRYAIHFGNFAGPWLRPLWVILALCPAAFVVSGLWLYARRRGPRSRAAA